MSEWLRVTRQTPCPICAKTDWCLVLPDMSKAICARVAEGSDRIVGVKGAGWLHVLRDSDDRQRPRVRRVTLQPTEPARNFDELAARYRRNVRETDVERLALELGVSAESLQRLDIGHDEITFTFPMRDADGRIIGLRRRLWDGAKRAVLGSKNGLFVPDGLDDSAMLVICEGESDSAALLTLGIDVVGRAGCRAGAELLVRYCRGRAVAILRDNDGPGRTGAMTLARRLLLVCQSARVFSPPDGIKDARDWLRAGATNDDVRRAIREARPRGIEVSHV